jgi:UDP-glucose 4-epimerase
MNRVLITGADTPLGHNLIRRLLEDPHVRHVLAVGLEPDPSGLPAGPRVSYASTDLTRPRSVSELLFGRAAELDIDTIVHAAHHRSARTPTPDRRALHVDGTHELLLQAERHPTIERFVYRSFSDVYRIDHREPNLLDEDCPLTLGAGTPPLVLDRVAADVDVCTRMGMSRLHLVVLRCAEVLARNSGSQLWDYLQSRVCMRPLGFDPMINVLSLEDAGRALMSAMRTRDQGVFNIPGADTLPLSRLIRSWHRRDVQVPGPLLTPLYRLRSATVGFEFRYDLNMRRFHFGGLLDGARAREHLGYAPHHPVPEIARRS